MFRRNPDSPLSPDQWVDALLANGWETWAAGRGAWCVMDGRNVYTAWLRRFDVKSGGPTRDATLRGTFD
ncbi:hypothetical protein FBY26_0962 [Phycicoccus sp. SLBN-51]|nr:hypothetical protein FBY26_0962 [Phycicoccus sp. SLBN-51]